jgi:pimeloyl-ACP methyl ester carboxylesterase
LKNIVLVHGAWADGSGWQGVYDVLTKRGYNVSIVQNPLTSLEADVAAIHRVLARQDGPAVLVGHSYGGVVITEAGTADNVAALVYVAAFMPDAGESLLKLTEGGAQAPVQPSRDGFLFFDPKIMPAAFAGDLPAEQGAFIAASQVPVAAAAFQTPVTTPAWKTKPSWVVVSTDDRIIPPDAQRAWANRAGATAVEVKGSHVVFMSHPAAVADVIEAAAKGGT